MATAYSEASGSQPYIYCTFTGTSHETYMRYAWSLYYHADYAISTSSSKPVHARIKGSAQSDWTVLDERDYSINGKTGNNLIASGTVDIPRTHSQQTVTVYVRIEFGGVVYSGVTLGTRNGTASVTIGAKTSYAVTYNANGGEGAPASQTKWHGESLTLSSASPARANYSFLGWNTKADGTGTAYSPGQAYTGNAALALYAQWQIALVAPRISAIQLYHSDSTGEPDDEGTCLSFVATLECAQSQEAAVATGYSVSIGGTTVKTGTVQPGQSGAVGNVTAILSGYQADDAYTATMVASYTEGGDTVTATGQATAAARFYIWDFAAGGKGIGVGQKAPSTSLPARGRIEIAMDATLTGDTRMAGHSKPIADFPVHRGNQTVGNTTWDYVIYASGKAECWGKTSNITTGSFQTWGSMYFAGPLGTANYPTGLFSSVSYATAEWVNVGSDAWSGQARGTGSTTAPPQVYAYRGQSASSHTGYIQYYARGSVGSISY